MAQMPKTPPWKCRDCRKLAKATADYCPHCGNFWSSCWDKNYVHQNGQLNNYAGDYRDEGSWRWPSTSRRQPSASPRRRRKPSQSPRGQPPLEDKGSKGKGNKNKAKGAKEAGKGKDSQEPAYKTLDPPLPPQVANPFAASTSSGLSTPSTSTEVQQMIQALKNAYPDPSQIPAPLQQWTVKAEASEDKDCTRNLHKETTRLGQAQKMLRETRLALTSYEKAWKDHVMSALALLKEQKEAYQQQRSQLADMERKAIIELTGARRAIAKLNKVEDKKEVIAVDDEELKEDNEEMAIAEEIGEDSSMKEFLEQYAASVGLTISIQQAEGPEAAEQERKRPRDGKDGQVFREGGAQPAAAQQK